MSAAEALEVAASRLGAAVRRDEPLGPHTTYRVGGPAALFATVEDLDDLRRCGRVIGETGIDVLVVGNGSNLLVSDAGFAGIALRLGDGFAAVGFEGTSAVAGGAAQLPVVARQSVAAGLGGFEWAVGVPGTIGGAVRMNAGGHGSDMAAHLRRVRVFDTVAGETFTVDAARLDLGYRRSNIRPDQIVVEATLELSPLPPESDHVDATGAAVAGPALLREIVRWRRANQPGGANAGSVFANPPGASAGELIERCGLKGHRVGTAAVSDKHANFIQSDADGRADDVFALMVDVRDRVEAETGVRLHPETVLVGYDPEVFA